MAVSTFNLSEFQAQVFSKGLARTNRFEVVISVPNFLNASQSRIVSLLCETASLPLLNLNVKPHRIYGPAHQRPVTSEYGGEGISFTFHVDREMYVKKFFDEWIQYIVDRNNFTVAYQSEYSTTVQINQLDEQNNVTYSIILEDAFPRNINIMELNNTAQNQTHRVTVLFAYRKWKNADDPSSLRVIEERPVVPISIASIPTITETETSRVLNSLGTPSTNVDFSEGTFSVPAA